MTELSAELAPQVLAACQSAAAEAAAALARALGGSFQLEPRPASGLDRTHLPDGFNGPGLTLVLHFGPVAAGIMLPETGRLIPQWCAAPGPAERSKLETLAQELGTLVVPEGLVADRTEASRVTNLGDCLGRGEPAEGAVCLPIAVRTAEQQAVMSLVWPLTRPEAVLAGTEAGATATAGAPAHERLSELAAERARPATEPPQSGTPADPLAQLPDYARSLLKIRVPLSVRLASKRQRIGQILELCPGAIITFDKTCDEMLDLTAGGCMIAVGEAVKVGDKFGLRISSMTMPGEHFESVVLRH